MRILGNLKRHLGSTIALVLGCLAFIAGVSQVSGQAGGDAEGLIAGPIMILGALAYRSAKKRKLSEVSSTVARRALEATSIFLIFPIVLLQNNLQYRLETHPFSNLFIPIWAIVAYLVVALRTKKQN